MLIGLAGTLVPAPANALTFARAWSEDWAWGGQRPGPRAVE